MSSLFDDEFKILKKISSSLTRERCFHFSFSYYRHRHLTLFSWLCVFTELKTLDTELSWENFIFFCSVWKLNFQKFLIISAEMNEADLYPFFFSLFFSALLLRFSSSRWFFMMKICEKSRFNFIHHKMTLDFILCFCSFFLLVVVKIVYEVPTFYRMKWTEIYGVRMAAKRDRNKITKGIFSTLTKMLCASL